MGKKGQETYDRIVAAAMHSYSRFGEKGTTFQSIADIAGVSQPLVARHFRNREAVLPAVIDKFLTDARKVTESAVDSVKNPRDKLREYIRISLRMFRDKPEVFKIYLLLHYYSGFMEIYRDKNSDIKRVAVERITKMIQDGISEKVFKKCNARLVAKIIHSSLVGVILSMTTEHAEFTDQQLLKMLELIVFDFLEAK